MNFDSLSHSGAARPTRLRQGLLFTALAAALLAGCGGGLDDSSDSFSSSNNSSSGGGGSVATCDGANYPGDKSDPQVYTLDAAAQLRACQYKATGDAQYLEQGNQTCKVLDGFLQSVDSTFKPLYCSGSRLKV
jgi:hypothetical protein